MKIKIVNSVSKYDKEMHKKKSKLDGIVMTPETFSKVFSPERIKLLQHIYKDGSKNIYQLAKELKKPYEVIFRNIKYLEGIGIINIEDIEKRKIPRILSDISIDMLTAEA